MQMTAAGIEAALLEAICVRSGKKTSCGVYIHVSTLPKRGMSAMGRKQAFEPNAMSHAYHLSASASPISRRVFSTP